jgi:hypothetical protein
MRWRSESLEAAALPKRTRNTPAANVQNGRRNEGFSHQRVFLAVSQSLLLAWRQT